eukprot:3374952-Prymnesium_polylepis.1
MGGGRAAAYTQSWMRPPRARRPSRSSLARRAPSGRTHTSEAATARHPPRRRSPRPEVKAAAARPTCWPCRSCRWLAARRWPRARRRVAAGRMRPTGGAWRTRKRRRQRRAGPP